ncbi:hypothetical protein HK102_008786 [Quaeritorhiza haematococci]|nr:hypothetical protein HK102_008786 [Quaeritorhiza haematococci]
MQLDVIALTSLVVEDYDGEFSDDGRIHGSGVVKYKSGHTYSGTFHKGYMHGSGSYLWSDGLAYSGDFANNRIEGQDGCTYQGQVSGGLRNGLGTFHYRPSEAKYIGEWKDGKMNGQGKLFYEFTDSAAGSYYEGSWLDGKKDGKGVMRYASGNIYDGEWRNNKKHGKGTMIWKDRHEEYSGEWQDNGPMGNGMDLELSNMRRAHGTEASGKTT